MCKSLYSRFGVLAYKWNGIGLVGFTCFGSTECCCACCCCNKQKNQKVHPSKSSGKSIRNSDGVSPVVVVLELVALVVVMLAVSFAIAEMDLNCLVVRWCRAAMGLHCHASIGSVA